MTTSQAYFPKIVGDRAVYRFSFDFIHFVNRIIYLFVFDFEGVFLFKKIIKE